MGNDFNNLNCGLDRVLEPLGTVPVTAWKLDAGEKINSNEARIKLKYFQLERDNYQQLANSCNYDDEKIKAKIIDIVEKRGKLHNPFTNSAGVIFGHVAEMGEEYERNTGLKVGDEFLSITTSCGIPMHVDRVIEINHDYAQVELEGYAIVFLATARYTGDMKHIRYTMVSVDEEGTLHNVYKLAKKGMNIMVIGKDLVSAAYYLSSVRKAVGGNCHLDLVFDYECIENYNYEDVKKVMGIWADSVSILNLGEPMNAINSLDENVGKKKDLIVNCEDIKGAEVFTVMMVKNEGMVLFASITNGYEIATLIAESMGKNIHSRILNQELENSNAFTEELVLSNVEQLDEINKIYEEAEKDRGFSVRRKRNMMQNRVAKIDDFVYMSPVTEELVGEVLNVAKYDCNVIIEGETGTGKEKIMEIIHKNSSRNGNSCIKVNCATIQENLAESEFFGYDAGAFTGANREGKKGYFELANGGVLFLDEIGQLSLNMQSKLLRVLQENAFYRVGGTKQINVNVRVICANNIPLMELVSGGKFREDLYYRLNISLITVPPLREREEDVVCLSRAFLDKYCRKYGIEKSFEDGAIKALQSYSWPGNVRELENMMHRLVINSKEATVFVSDVEKLIHGKVYDDVIDNLRKTISEGNKIEFEELIKNQEVRLIEYALKKEGTTRKAADFLGITQAKLMRKKQKYEIN